MDLILGLNWGPIDSISTSAKISLMCSRHKKDLLPVQSD